VSNDLVIKLNGTADRLTVQSFFASSTYNRIEQVQFDDGTVWGLAELARAVITPTVAGTVYGSTDADNYDLRNGVNSWVSGGTSSGTVNGNDTYLFGVGAGQDTIYDYDTTVGNVDTVKLVGVLPSQVSLERPVSGSYVSNDLVIKLNGTADRLTVQSFFASSTYNRIEQVQFDDGMVWGLAELAGARIAGSEGADTISGTASNDIINGQGGNDVLSGGGGNDILQGGMGDDTLNDSSGSNYFDGGAGADMLTGGTAGEFYLGGAGSDRITTGAGNDVVAFNRGDGADVIVASGGTADTLSLGGGIAYSDLALRKSGNHLILETGGADSITFENWYAAPANPNVINLQIITEAMAEFDATSVDPLLNKKVQQFDFMGLVGDFDAALAANPSMTSWTLVDSLLARHLAGSDVEALGGDLAYCYGRDNSLAGMGFAAVQEVLGNTQFGVQAQTLRPLQDLQLGAVRLG
jgi:hypothetical protein